MPKIIQLPLKRNKDCNGRPDYDTLVNLVYQRFVAKHEKFSLQQRTGNHPIQRTGPSLELFNDHLNFKQTIGLTPLSPNGTCHFIAFDADNANDHLSRLTDLLTSFDLTPFRVVGRPGRDGHLFLFLKDVPAFVASKFARLCLRLLQIPENDSVGAKPYFGSTPIRFPLGLNRKKECEGHVDSIPGIDDSDSYGRLLALYSTTEATREQLEPILEANAPILSLCESGRMSYERKEELLQAAKEFCRFGLTQPHTSHYAYFCLGQLAWSGCPELGIPAFGPDDEARAEWIYNWAVTKHNGFNFEINRRAFHRVKLEILKLCRWRRKSPFISNSIDSTDDPVVSLVSPHYRQKANQNLFSATKFKILSATLDLSLREDSKRLIQQDVAKACKSSPRIVIKHLSDAGHVKVCGSKTFIQVDLPLLRRQVKELDKVSKTVVNSEVWGSGVLKEESANNDGESTPQPPKIHRAYTGVECDPQNAQLAEKSILDPQNQPPLIEPPKKRKPTVYRYDKQGHPVLNPYTNTTMWFKTAKDANKAIQRMIKWCWAFYRIQDRLFRHTDGEDRRFLGEYFDINEAFKECGRNGLIETRNLFGDADTLSDFKYSHMGSQTVLAVTAAYLKRTDAFRESGCSDLLKEGRPDERLLKAEIVELIAKFVREAVLWERDCEYTKTLKSTTSEFQFSLKKLSFWDWVEERSNQSEEVQLTNTWRLHKKRVVNCLEYFSVKLKPNMKDLHTGGQLTLRMALFYSRGEVYKYKRRSA